MSPIVPAQVLVQALAMAAKARYQAEALAHLHGIAKLRAGVVRDLIEAIVVRRVDAVEHQCTEVLKQYADQAQHYLDQQRRFGERLLESRDPIERLELSSRLTEVDTKLGEIRADAKLIYERMCQAIAYLGGNDAALLQQVSYVMGGGYESVRYVSQ
ncbi:hypothetical protein ACG04Q_21490 [Roseateles sp. DXS20W]|uniref:Flagellar protein FlgN n=1 Tax=Pelomonas lactea TaxID=3299030 RepID=A0ABW7GQA8_9BURK